MKNLIFLPTLIFLVVSVIVLIKESWRNKVAQWFDDSIFLVVVVLLSLNAVIYLMTDTWDGPAFVRLAIYFAVPTSLCAFARFGNLNRFGWPMALLHLAIICWIWLIDEWSLVALNWKISGNNIPLGGVSVLIFSLLAFTAWLRVDLKLDWKFTWQDWKYILGFVALVFCFILPITLLIGFSKFGVSAKAAQWPIVFVSIWFSIALVEELIFRAMIQRVLVEKLGVVFGIIVASIIFGFAHIDNRAGIYSYPNWPYVVLATIVGAGYGYVYHKRNLQSAITFHCSVDFLAWLFFKGF